MCLHSVGGLPMILMSFLLFSAFPLIFAQNALQNGINQFTNKLVRNIELGHGNTNFVLSPLSIHSVFTQVLIGAGGKTQAELARILGVSRSRRLKDQYSQLSADMPALKTANILALNKGFTPAKSFVQYLKHGFGSEVREYDMKNDKMGTVEEINSIVATHTNNKILNLLSPENIEDTTRMVLINAVYFKELWKTAFNPKESFSGDFKTSTIQNVKTKFMRVELKARYDETDSLEILQLPYKDRSTSMLFFLPKPGYSSHNIMDSVAKYQPKNIKNTQKSTVVATIPKFKISFETVLKEEMKKIGIKEVFTEKANFTYISEEKIRVSDGVHKAFIEVTEEGTEAAAATALYVFSPRSALSLPPEKNTFFANRPFLFMIYDSANNIPILIGKITNPSNLVAEEKVLNIQNKSGTGQVSPKMTKTPRSFAIGDLSD